MRFGAHAVRGRSRLRFPAFTLAEMLIVIGIVALLMAILLPSVGRVREQANLALCQNNMKKLYDVFALTGTLPGSSPNSLPGSGGWVAAVEKQNCMANLVCPVDENREGKTANDPTSGLIRFLATPPPSAVFGSGLESNSQLTCFRERSAYTLPKAVSVNMTPAGSAGSVPAGTVVDSFLLMLDPVGHSSATVSGNVSFGGEILGIIWLAGTLDQTDPIVGAPETQYPTGLGARGVESGQGIVFIASDHQTVTINGMYSGGTGEQVRVIVKQGGLTSYAMNDWAGGTWGRSDQILLVEYKKAAVDLNTANKPPDDLVYWLAPRHRGKLNVLYNHGGFEILTAKELISRTKTPVQTDYASIWKR
jgi:hypothetical protein